MIKLLIFFLLIFSSCSPFKSENIVEKKSKEVIKEINSEKIQITQNFNSDLEIKLPNKADIKSKEILKNNFGRQEIMELNYKVNNYKFKKIRNFSKFEPNIIFEKNNIFFFQKKGSIIKLNSENEIIWEINNYSKQEKKLGPLLTFGSNNDTIVVTDNLSKYYAINKLTGEIIWTKTNTSPLNSEIKIINDKFFAIDQENIIYCYSLKDGKKIWSYKTDNFFIKTRKKLSIIISDNKIVFNNSVGDITALDIINGSLIWQMPTQNNQIYADTITLSTSSLVNEEEYIIFSNNKNEFYSLDLGNGFINWKQKINSDIRPVVTEKIIFTVSTDGFLFLIDVRNGNIIKSQDLLINIKKRNSIKPVGISLGVDKIFVTFDNGLLLITELKNGKIIKSIKIDNQKISEPFVFNKKLFVIKDNSIIELN